ncbi:hypothetical protein [Zunongwangia profunda]|uniref:hypothetical protein n=1 Tax=Zunongwangia profunda TaxID=398743 RepID=UPI00248EEFE8|nr:hypothetical protein [Zunongwangia profunda]
MYKEGLERHREMIITILSPHMEKKDRKKSMSQLYPLPWEPEYKRLQKQKTKPKQSPPKTKEDLNKLFGGEMK